MQVIKIDPGCKPELTELPNTLRAYQQAVGGYIEAHTITRSDLPAAAVHGAFVGPNPDGAGGDRPGRRERRGLGQRDRRRPAASCSRMESCEERCAQMTENDRLTHKRANGIKDGYWSAATKERLVQRLAAYEDTGLEPWEIKQLLAAAAILATEV